MHVWLPLSLLALVVWAVQRLLSKVALGSLGTRKFYLLSAAVSLLVYLPYLVWRPPPREERPALSFMTERSSRPLGTYVTGAAGPRKRATKKPEEGGQGAAEGLSTWPETRLQHPDWGGSLRGRLPVGLA